jgi:hypothetical protein
MEKVENQHWLLGLTVFAKRVFLLVVERHAARFGLQAKTRWGPIKAGRLWGGDTMKHPAYKEMNRSKSATRDKSPSKRAFSFVLVFLSCRVIPNCLPAS